MDDTRTTVVVQRFLNELAGVKGDAPAEPIVRALLASAVDRLHLLCTALLFRNYPRLARPPLNLQADELLSSVVERLLKAMREMRPQTVRQFFALANRHMRWELNDLARRLDNEARQVGLRESLAGAPPDSSGSQVGADARRILEAIEGLPDDEREIFDLVRIQGMSHREAAEVLGVSEKTVQRRLVRCLAALTRTIGDLRPALDSNEPA
jgi:RNA polymerase sigma-70 factor (ECF subfamily)